MHYVCKYCFSPPGRHCTRSKNDSSISDCNLRLTSISRIPRLKTEMQPEFSQWGGQTWPSPSMPAKRAKVRQTPAQRLFAASDDGLPRAAGPRGACCRRVCARAGAGSRRIVLRWGARVVGGLWRRGEGAVVWCLLRSTGTYYLLRARFVKKLGPINFSQNSSQS
eukprot:COSAG02_NODE_1658_length_11466_cov_36.222046_6_plen_165_part_00